MTSREARCLANPTLVCGAPACDYWAFSTFQVDPHRLKHHGIQKQQRPMSKKPHMKSCGWQKREREPKKYEDLVSPHPACQPQGENKQHIGTGDFSDRWGMSSTILSASASSPKPSAPCDRNFSPPVPLSSQFTRPACGWSFSAACSSIRSSPFCFEALVRDIRSFSVKEK